MKTQTWIRGLAAALSLSVGFVGVASAQTPAEQGHGEHKAAGHGEHKAEGHGDHPEGCAHHAPMAGTAKDELPDTSLFLLSMDLKDQHGQTRHLKELQGQPSVMVMFYGSCKTACPMLFSDAKRLESMLPPEVREKTNFVFVTIDSKRDTPEVLKAYGDSIKIDQKRWWLVSTGDADTRTIAATLGVQYRAVEKGEFSHTNRIVVVSPQGEIDLVVDGLKQPLDNAAGRLIQLASGASKDGGKTAL